MSRRNCRDIIAEGLDVAGEHRLERNLFGSDDADTIAAAVARAVEESLGARVVSGIRYHASVAATVGVEIDSGERIAVKFIRRDRSDPWEAALLVQQTARAAGLPAPQPLVGPFSLGEATVVVETWLDPGTPDDPASPATRSALAAGLHALIRATSPLVGSLDLRSPLRTAPGSEYGEPHDLRFDFDASAAGAEWIDELNTEARRVLANEPADAIGHVDWRGGNVVVGDGRLAAIYDWDSAAVGSEAMFVAMSSTVWSLAWEWGRSAHPVPASMAAFVADYETARGRAFDDHDRPVIRAAQISQLAYSARCEHSDRELGVISGASRPFADRLRSVAAAQGLVPES